MKLCANLSLMFTEVPLLERFSAARAAGFEAVEIQFPYEESISDLDAAKTDANLELVLINVPAGDLMSGGEGLASVPDKVDAFSEALEQCVEYVSALNVQAVNVLAGRCNEQARLPEYWQTFEWNLEKAANALMAVNALTTFEAINTKDMPNFLIHRAEHMWRVMDKLGHENIKAQYDLYHMAMMGENLWHDLSKNCHRIGHMQFADMPGRHEPGTGGLGFKALFDLVHKSEYQGYMGAEYKPSVATSETLSWMTDGTLPAV
jgi:hydroxypyruvate isomerase